MKAHNYFLIFLSFFFFSACATVDRPEIQPVDEKKPQISKTLSQDVAKRFLKRKVAIARFTNETVYGQGFFVDKNDDRIGKQAMDILSAKLTAADKFLLLERSDIEKINEELKRGDIAGLNIGADYLILGSVSEFGRKEVGEVGIFSRTKKQVAVAKVNLRLVDVATGQIIYSEEGDGEAFSEAGTVMGVGARAGYDSSLNDKAISAALSKLVNNVIENLMDKPWRSYILSYDNGSYIIAGGKSQGIQANDTFAVYRRGKKVKNPQTNMLIELPGQLIGLVKVNALVGDSSNNEIGLCAVVSGTLPTENFSELYIQELGNR